MVNRIGKSPPPFMVTKLDGIDINGSDNDRTMPVLNQNRNKWDLKQKRMSEIPELNPRNP